MIRLKHPSCSTCSDGEIYIKMSGSLRPYKFRLSGPAISNPIWQGPDTHGQRTKIYLGLQKGVFYLEVDVSFDPKKPCILEEVIELLDPCPKEITANCDDDIQCEGSVLRLYNPDNAMNYNGPSPNGVLVPAQQNYTTWGLPEYLRFRNVNPNGPGPFPAYQVGKSEWTVEFWFQPTVDPIVVAGLSNRAIFRKEMAANPPLGPFNNFFVFFKGGLKLGTVMYGNAATEYIGVESSAGALSLAEMHHVVITKTGIASPSNPLTISCLRMYVNGIEINTTDYFGPSTTIGPNINDDNLSFITGDYVVGTEWVTGALAQDNDGVNRAYAATFNITNLRHYARVLPKSEIQKNYLLGCAGKPSNCSKLLIYAPLDQVSGNIAQELAHNNHGELINVRGERVKKGGDPTNNIDPIWYPICCKPTNDLITTIKCCAQDCEDEYALFKFKFIGEDTNPITAENSINPITPGVDDSSIASVIIRASSTCLPEDVVAYSTDEIMGAVGVVVTPPFPPVGPGALTPAERVLFFVNAYNSVPAAARYDSIATANLNEVTIRFPYTNAKSKALCGKNMTVCLFNGPANVHEFYSDQKVEYTPNVVVCCVDNNDLCCDIASNDVSINV